MPENGVFKLFQKLEDSVSARGEKIKQELIKVGATDEDAAEIIVFKKTKPKIKLGDLLELPTFDPNIRRTISGQMYDRFLFADRINDMGQNLLGIADIQKICAGKKMIKAFNSLKNHWNGSAPSRFSAGDISLFAVDSIEDFMFDFIVWSGAEEPQIWAYHGQSEERYKDLKALLKWMLQ